MSLYYNLIINIKGTEWKAAWWDQKKTSKNLYSKFIIFFLSLIKIKKLIERIAQDTNKLVQIKDELKGFTSLHWFSRVLNTSNPFVKGLWMIFFLVLFSFLIQNSLENLNDYYQYTVITKIEYINENPMTLPAFTLCLVSLKANLVNATLGESLYIYSIRMWQQRLLFV